MFARQSGGHAHQSHHPSVTTGAGRPARRLRVRRLLRALAPSRDRMLNPTRPALSHEQPEGFTRGRPIECRLSRIRRQCHTAPVPMVTGATLRRIVRARDYLHAEASRVPTLDDLARVAGLSRAHLSRSLTSTFGVPPHQYLVQLPMTADAITRSFARGVSSSLASPKRCRTASKPCSTTTPASSSA